MKIKIKLLENGVMPEYKTVGSAGVDLVSSEDQIIPPKEIRLIKTGIKVEIPEGYEAQIRSRSGLALNGIVVANSPGTIDSDYRGEIGVILANLSNKPFGLKKGMRIAQMVLSKVERIEFEVVDELSESNRGSKGFGSTGV